MTSWPANTSTPSSREQECLRLLERASAYLESDMAEEDKEHFRRHLERCMRCKGFVATLKDTVSMLQGLSPTALPLELKQRLLAIPKGQQPG